MTRENIRRTIHSQRVRNRRRFLTVGTHPPIRPRPFAGAPLLPPLTPPRSFSMEDVVALERLATLHGAFVDDAARAVGVESFCQLCLKTLDDASGTAAPGRTCPSGHVCCLSCASVLNPDDARAPWSSRAGCPACHADDTDDGMTRLFARPESRGERFDDKPRRHPLAPLLIRDALTADDADALAGVLVAERRAVFKALDDEPPTPSASSDAAWPPWDCGAQLRSALASIPPAADAERAFPGASSTSRWSATVQLSSAVPSEYESTRTRRWFDSTSTSAGVCTRRTSVVEWTRTPPGGSWRRRATTRASIDSARRTRRTTTRSTRHPSRHLSRHLSRHPKRHPPRRFG